MHVTRFLIEAAPAGPPPSQAQAELVRDLLWAQARPESGLEHVTAIAVEPGIHVAVFQREDAPVPDLRLRDLVDSAARGAGLAGGPGAEAEPWAPAPLAGARPLVRRSAA
jgi:hypothetical protein